MIHISRLRVTAHEHSAERHFQRSWDRAIARTASDSHLDEINAIFARQRRLVASPSAHAAAGPRRG